MEIHGWTVDLGQGARPVELPHVWGSQADLRREGPAIYETRFTPPGAGRLVFEGVSARAKVFVNGELRADHLGIWDAFLISLTPGEEAHIAVEVVKNGGASVPVGKMASGFLPYVFGTFGGIFRPVLWTQDEIVQPPAQLRARFESSQLIVDGNPTFVRGILHWGWYPELGCPHPSRERCLAEARALRELGFNLVKFCLWAPPHHYLDVLDELGMLAWMELPVWNPGPDAIAQISQEVLRIVEQYRRHGAIVLWTLGCELGPKISRQERQSLFERAKAAAGGALMKDSSGGAEMYGGDPVEFGDFADFHPYCDLARYPEVLDALAPGPRPTKAVLLGECNDCDAHRDLVRIATERPYWASEDPALNDQGVRWQFDLPRVVAESRFARDSEANNKLMASSRSLKLFVHRTFHEWLRSRKDFCGSVITGISDTPISSSGFFDDLGAPRFTVEETASFLGPVAIFLIPRRRLPWIDGGNRAATPDPWHYFTGPGAVGIGMHAENGWSGQVEWELSLGGRRFGGGVKVEVGCEPTEVAEALWDATPAAEGLLVVKAGSVSAAWPIFVVDKLDMALPPSASGLKRPAFRECAYEFRNEALERCLGRWETLLMVSSGRFLDPQTLPDGALALMIRVDTRTYEELPVIALSPDGSIVTTLVGEGPATSRLGGAIGHI
ncbi:MAG TPA: hypothetical protein VFG65_01360 [Fimbriimonadales bacterium]|nr:hypothetical protein [Fimbriimonadales bacterium]